MALPQFPDPMMQTLSSCSDDVWGLTAAEASMGFSNDILVDVVEVGDDEDGLEKRGCEGDLLFQVGSESTAVTVVVVENTRLASSAIFHKEEDRRMLFLFLLLMWGRRWSAKTRTRGRCTNSKFVSKFFSARREARSCGE